MTKIISNSGSLILNDTSSMAIGLLRCRVEGDYVLVSDGGSIQWKLNYKETTVDGDSFDSSEDLLSTISSFNKGGGSGTGAVESVTGDLVTGTSSNPVINLPTDVVKDSDLGAISLKDKVAIADIDTTGTTSSTNFLRGDGLWTSPNRNFTGVTNVTANRTVQSIDIDRNRLTIFNGDNLVYTIPYPATGFSNFGSINIANIGATSLEIAKQSGSVILYSEDDFTRVKAKSQATLTYLGSDTWILSGGLGNA